MNGRVAKGAVRPVPRAGPARLRPRRFRGHDQHPRHTFQILSKRSRRLRHLADELTWPPNVWMGMSVETPDQMYRVEDLRAVPAAVPLLSCEPLLAALGDLNLAGTGWVIAGGENGRAYRPVAAEWIRQLRDGCGRQSVPF
jgi:protein gp37